MRPIEVEPRRSVAPESGHALYVWTICLVAAMGGLLFGYDWIVIAGAKPFFEKFFGITSEAISGWANSCALLGCLVGSLVSGGMSDRYGRKRLLVASAVLFVVSSVLTGWAPTFEWFVVWRIVGGMAIGMASNLSPIYIAEVAPTHLRGRLVAINQLTIVFGILGAQIVNWLIGRGSDDGATANLMASAWYTEYAWRWMFTAVAIPSVLFFLGSLMLPESPRWLVKNGKPDRARDVLARIGGQQYAAYEVRDIQRTLSDEEVERVRFQDLLEPRMFKILMLGVFLAVLQQWSGINVIYSYAEEVFKEAGYSTNGMLFGAILLASVNLITTPIAIATVDRLGRRGLMLFGCAGIALSHFLLGAAYANGWQGYRVVTLMVLGLGFYGLSLAPIVWVLISEIFPNRIRGAAVSVAVASLWVADFLLIYTFPILKSSLGMTWAFWLYGAICVGGFFVILYRVPETKGKSLEQIERELVGGE